MPPSREHHPRFQKDILGFEIAMDQPSIFEDGESIQQLRGEDLHELGAEALELVLFDEFVQVRRQQLEDEA